MNHMAVPLCAVCGMRPATHVCQGCGNGVCSNCIDPVSWSCSECRTNPRLAAPQMYSTWPRFSLATWLFFIAFAVIFVGMLLIAFGSVSNFGGVSGGTIILIGPIPIILGSGPYSVALIVLATILTIAGLVFVLLLRRRS